MLDEKTKEMLAINVAQKRYYEVASGGETSKVNSSGTNLYRTFRKAVLKAFSEADQQESINTLHRKWIGDVTGLKVLELGVGSGSALSVELAKQAMEYVAIDLSTTRMETLGQTLAGIDGVKLYTADFLNDTTFPERDFDLIYALAVFHHFKYIDAFLDVVDKRLAPGGRVITYDPVETTWASRLVRAAYRPFQTDAAWEHPFKESSLRAIETKFKVLDCQGVMGASKYAPLFSFPSQKFGQKIAKKWHNTDMRKQTTPASLRRCLRACYHLQKR